MAERQTLDDRPDLQARFSEERIVWVLDHPRLGEALRNSAEAALALNEREPRMSATLKDVGRFWAAMLCVYLHVTPGGLTLARLREACAISGFMSPNAAEALLAHLKDIGFVVPAAHQPDRRQIRLEAASALVEFFRQRNRIELASAAILDPALQPVLDAWDDHPMLEICIEAQGPDFLVAAPALERDTPNLQLLWSRHAGPLMMMRLMSGGEAGDSYPPLGPVPLSMNALAQEFEVSRTHVARFIEAGEEVGFFERPADGRSVVLTPLLYEKLAVFYAQMYLEWMTSGPRGLALLKQRQAAG